MAEEEKKKNKDAEKASEKETPEEKSSTEPANEEVTKKEETTAKNETAEEKETTENEETAENEKATEKEESANKKEEITEKDAPPASEEVLYSDGDDDANTKSVLEQDIEKKYRLFSIVQKIVILMIISAGVLFVYLFLSGEDRGHIADESSPEPFTKINKENYPPEVSQESEINHAGTIKKTDLPISLQSAESLYNKGDYTNAYIVYDKLRKRQGINENSNLIGDYIKLRMGMCSAAIEFSKGREKGSNLVSPENTLKQLTQSESPIIRITACCNLARIARNKGDYLSARSYLYKVLGLCTLIESGNNWRENLIRECKFAATEQLTRKIISLSGTSERIPENIWASIYFEDLLKGKDIEQIENILQQGREVIADKDLLPKIEKHGNEQNTDNSLWRVKCSGVCIDDFLAKLGRTCGVGIEWEVSEQISSVKNRTLSIYIPETTVREITTTAAGSVGLLAYKKDTGDVFGIYNPRDYSELDSHINTLASKAGRLWQMLLLKTEDRPRIAKIHFWLATLYSELRMFTESIAEYKLVFNSYPYSKVVPVALMESSRIKTDLKDYQGAREDLRQLVEQFPDSPLSNKASIHLAKARFESAEYEQAYRLFKKAYYFADDSNDAVESAFSAALCNYRLGDIESATKWVSRYLEKADENSDDFYKAWYLAGKCFSKQGEKEKANNAFKKAVSGKLPVSQYLDSLKQAVKFSIQNGKGLQALELIKKAQEKDLPSEDRVELLLIKADAMAELGLIEKATGILDSNLGYATSRELKAKIMFSLGKYQKKMRNLEAAKSYFTRAVTQTEKPEFARQVNLKLAEVYLETGESQRTVDICSELLNSAVEKELRSKARYLLARAYNAQKKFDKAIELLASGDEEKQFSKKLDNTNKQTSQEEENISRN